MGIKAKGTGRWVLVSCRMRALVGVTVANLISRLARVLVSIVGADVVACVCVCVC